MNSEWFHAPLGDLAAKVTKGTTPTTIGGKFVDDGPVKFVKVESLTDEGHILPDKLASIDHETDRLLARSKIQAGDILFSIAGTIGRVAVVPNDFGLANTNQAIAIIRLKDSVDRDFIYYALKSAIVREQTAAGTVQAVQANFSLSSIKSLSVKLPASIEDQRKQSSLLRLIDDKIANNRALAADLEAMARAIFKSWFVDFDPVKAKMEGRAPAGMDADTAALFPNELVESELGLIPKGWVSCAFSSIIDIWSGGTPKTKVDEYWGGDIPWFSVVDAPAPGEVFVIATEKTITQDGLANSPTKFLPLGSTIVSARGTVGRTAVVCGSMTMNQSCYALKGHLGDWFTYLSITRQIDWLKHHAHGGVFDTITRSTFDGLQICRPDRGCVEQFETLITPLFRRVEQLTRESANLAALRDTLLPRLISGKLRVPETHAAMAEPVL